LGRFFERKNKRKNQRTNERNKEKRVVDKKLENKIRVSNKEKLAGRLHRPKAFRSGAQRMRRNLSC
jgi:hypothetical protein